MLPFNYAGIAMSLYPFRRIVVELPSGINLTSLLEDLSVFIEFTSGKALHIVYGMALLGIASAWSEYIGINETSVECQCSELR